MIYSVDLIEEQIRVAMGEKLRYKQVWLVSSVKVWADIKKKIFPTGILFVYRKILCSEGTQLNAVSMQKIHSKGSDLALVCFSRPLYVTSLNRLADWLSLQNRHSYKTGRITSYLPSGGPFVRMDSHVYSDYVVPPSYDSLLGKVYLSLIFSG